MIEKIISIHGVGKFDQYNAYGDVTLRRVTLVYGENGSGKSTLAAVLRSLQCGDATLIDERRRLGAGGANPRVTVLVDGSTATYEEGQWSRVRPGIETFDDKFVSTNVYAGHAIQPEHRRQLHRFALGTEAVQLSQRMDEIALELQRVNSEARDVESRIASLTVGSIAIRDFAVLQHNPEVDEAIRRTTAQLEASRIATEIRTKAILSTVALPEVVLEDIAGVLRQILTDVSEHAEMRLREHLRACMDQDGERWISQGLGYVKDGSCPFCGQSLDRSDLISVYRDYFNQAYVALKAEIEGERLRIDSLLSTEALLTVQRQVGGTQALQEFWSRHVNVAFPTIDFEELADSWTGLRNVLLDILRHKSDSPLEAIHLNPEAIDGYTRFNAIVVECENYNRRIEEANEVIETKKAEVELADIGMLSEELKQLQNIKIRYEAEAVELCAQYQELEDGRRGLDSEKTETRSRLEQLTQQLLSGYESRINSYLERFGAEFSIVRATERFQQGIPRIEYGLMINGEHIDLDADLLGPRPSFGTTLSSGDRAALALAFFLARLEGDADLSGKVVVLDDPVSSLDYGRRTQTCQEVRRLAEVAEQVIVLSHDPYFLRLLWDALDRSQVKTLCVRRRGTGTKLEEWDLSKETRGDYFEHYFALSEYLETGSTTDLRNLARHIRPLLEANLRMRRPAEFPPGMWLGDMIEKISGASSGALLGLNDLLNELSDINAYSSPFHHDRNREGADSHPITDSELRRYVVRTLNVVHA